METMGNYKRRTLYSNRMEETSRCYTQYIRTEMEISSSYYKCILLDFSTGKCAVDDGISESGKKNPFSIIYTYTQYIT